MTPDCVFCGLIRGGLLPEVDRTGVYHFEPLNPVVPGHRLFVSVEHFARPDQNSAVTGLLFNAAAQYAGERSSDYNLIVNAGSSASQTIGHVHVHYVPRYPGDGLQLPWTNH